MKKLIFLTLAILSCESSAQFLEYTTSGSNNNTAAKSRAWVELQTGVVVASGSTLSVTAGVPVLTTGSYAGLYAGLSGTATTISGTLPGAQVSGTVPEATVSGSATQAGTALTSNTSTYSVSSGSSANSGQIVGTVPSAFSLSTFATGTDAASWRTAIGSGTSNLALGSGSTQALAATGGTATDTTFLGDADLSGAMVSLPDIPLTAGTEAALLSATNLVTNAPYFAEDTQRIVISGSSGVPAVVRGEVSGTNDKNVVWTGTNTFTKTIVAKNGTDWPNFGFISGTVSNANTTGVLSYLIGVGYEFSYLAAKPSWFTSDIIITPDAPPSLAETELTSYPAGTLALWNNAAPGLSGTHFAISVDNVFRVNWQGDVTAASFNGNTFTSGTGTLDLDGKTARLTVSGTGALLTNGTSTVNGMTVTASDGVVALTGTPTLSSTANAVASGGLNAFGGDATFSGTTCTLASLLTGSTASIGNGSITVDAKGRITALVSPTGSGSGPLVSQSNAVLISATYQGAVVLNSGTLTVNSGASIVPSGGTVTATTLEGSAFYSLSTSGTVTNNATPADIAGISPITLTTGTYHISGQLAVISSGTGGSQVRVSCTGGTLFGGNFSAPYAAAPTYRQNPASAYLFTHATAASYIDDFEWTVATTGTATLQITHAQNNATADTSIVQAGSYVVVRKLP